MAKYSPLSKQHHREANHKPRPKLFKSTSETAGTTKSQHQLPIQQEQSRKIQIGELKSQNGKSTSKSKPEIKNGATGEQIHLGTPLIHQQSTEIVSTLSRNTNTREKGRRDDESTREINAIKGNNNTYTTKKLPEGGPTTVLWKPPAAGQRRRW